MLFILVVTLHSQFIHLLCISSHNSLLLFHIVGDLHGDLAKARDALKLAGVLSSDGQDTWTGQETVCIYNFVTF